MTDFSLAEQWIGRDVVEAINEMLKRKETSISITVTYYGYEFPVTIAAPEKWIKENT